MSSLEKNTQKINAETLKEILLVENKAENIEKVVESILNSLKTEITDLDKKMYHEISTLTKYIRDARSNIANIPYEIRNQDIPKATDELDAVVVATEEAADKIMDAAEQIEMVSKNIALEQATQLSEAVTLIYEACSFQDITGQRILKVVQTLKHIETKLAELFVFYSKGIVKSVTSVANNIDNSLLVGPQLPKDAKKQHEVDDILKKINR